MSTRPVLLVAAAALIDAENRILIAQRPEGKQLAGLWEFPGGKLEPGEGPEAALVRELQEELGITVRLADLVPHSFASHAYEKFHLLMPLFTCRTWQGTPVALEHAALAWATPREMAAYAMPPADEPLVRALCDRL
jgi:8-oxo-dGTP diphosphatase